MTIKYTATFEVTITQTIVPPDIADIDGALRQAYPNSVRMGQMEWEIRLVPSDNEPQACPMCGELTDPTQFCSEDLCPDCCFANDEEEAHGH